MYDTVLAATSKVKQNIYFTHLFCTNISFLFCFGVGLVLNIFFNNTQYILLLINENVCILHTQIVCIFHEIGSN